MSQAIAAAVAALCLAGCSFATTNRLPGGYRPELSPRCSASIMPPLGDLVLGSLLAIAAGDEVEQERARAPEGRDWSDAASRGAASLALFAAAIYGWRQIDRCDDAREAHDRWLEDHGYRTRRLAVLDGGGHAR